MGTSQPDTQVVSENHVTPTDQRRRWSAEEKRRIVEKTLVQGASVARASVSNRSYSGSVATDKSGIFQTGFRSNHSR